MRLNQFLAHAGLGSRRSVEDSIRAGRVRINGVPAHLGSAVDPDTDKVTLDGKLVTLPKTSTYMALHKPAGYTVTRQDPHGKRTVYELLPDRARKLAYVGRLDRESEGLLLFTDDGILTHKLLRPEYAVEKEYRVEIDGPLSDDVPSRLRAGIPLADDFTAVATDAEIVSSGPRSVLRIVLCEGKKREVRRMCQALGITVTRLVRTRFGPIRLGRQAAGTLRELTPEEVEQLQKIVIRRKKSVHK